MAKKVTPLFTGSEWDFNTIQRIADACYEINTKELKLDIYDNQFEIITSDQMLDAYASIGMPMMYNHWSFGKTYLQEEHSYRTGRSGLAYEIVSNQNPCVNYLMEENSATVQALVIAHAGIGHNAFFKNNYLFKDWTQADSILDYLVFARKYVAECEERYGTYRVERILDSAHALRNQGVDKYKRVKLSLAEEQKRQKEREEYVQKQVNVLWQSFEEKDDEKHMAEDTFPEEPEENILKFIEKNSMKLESWERELIRIVRMIAQYFHPQRQCLVGNHLVSTETGLVRLDNLVHDDGVKQREIRLLTEGNRITTTSHTFKTTAKTLKIKTKSGRIFQGTPEHPLQILADNGVSPKMQEIGYMSVGDKLCYRLNYDIFSKTDTKIKYPDCDYDALGQSEDLIHRLVKKPVNFDYDSSRLLGYLVDVSVTPKHEFGLVFDSQDVACDCQALLKSVFGIDVDVKDFYSAYYIMLRSKELADWLYANVPDKDSLNKHQLPAVVFGFNKESMRGYLRSFFDCQCSDYQFHHNDITICGDERDADDLQHLAVILTGFGIVSKLHEDFTAGHYSRMLSLSSNAMNIFLTNITTSRSCLLGESNSADIYGDEIVSIEDAGEAVVYDVTVPENHLFWTDSLISHNTKVMNEGFACWTHCYIMNRLYEKGLLTEGSMLEFMHVHSNVVYQPSFERGMFNPYALGLNLFKDIERMCKNPTEEDKIWFPHVAGENYLDVIKDAMMNYRDESFIRQFLSPALMREMRMFQIGDEDDDYYMVKHIHNEDGYKNIRRNLANQYELTNIDPDIQVYDANMKGNRHLYLMHKSAKGKRLEEVDACQCLDHVKRLWGFDVELTTYDSDMNYIESFTTVEHIGDGSEGEVLDD